MPSRVVRLRAELGKYAAVSGVATLVALILFNLLVHGFGIDSSAPLSGQPYLAYVLAHSVGMVISFHGSRNWAFRHRPPSHADGGWTAYAAINVATMVLPVACLWVSRHLLGLDGPVADNVSANLVGAALGLAARFYLFRIFVFKRPINLVEIYEDPAVPVGE
jgi:putative flippase GtrA